MSQEFKLVPASMLLDKSTIGAINFHCGDGSNLEIEECSEGLLWIGTVTDDDGKEVYGLHIMTAEYPEEGSTTLVEFEAPVPPSGAEVDKSPNGVKLEVFEIVCKERDLLQAENAALQQRLSVADLRVDELERKAKLYDQLQRGAELLPEGWMITVEVERDGGGVTLIDPQGNDLDYSSNRESMGHEVEDAIDEALGQQAAL